MKLSLMILTILSDVFQATSNKEGCQKAVIAKILDRAANTLTAGMVIFTGNDARYIASRISEHISSYH